MGDHGALEDQDPIPQFRDLLRACPRRYEGVTCRPLTRRQGRRWLVQHHATSVQRQRPQSHRPRGRRGGRGAYSWVMGLFLGDGTLLGAQRTNGVNDSR